MGNYNCCQNNSNKDNKTVNINNLQELTQKISINPKFSRLIRKLQATFKAIKFRRMQKTKKKKKFNFGQDFKFLPMTNELGKNLHEVNIKYKSLNDGEPLIGRKHVKYSDGSVYYGEWHSTQNIKHGRGILRDSNYNRYEGYFRNDKYNIFGILIKNNGEKYEGEFFFGYEMGSGKIYYPNGTRYEGQFKDGLKDGFGKEFLQGGIIYIGNFKNGKKDGIGKFLYSNGDIFEGEFDQEKLIGKGAFKFANNDKMILDYQKNSIQGIGVLNWSNGKKFIGEFNKNQIDGNGSLEWKSGFKYKFCASEGNIKHDEGEYFHPTFNVWKNIIVDSEKSFATADTTNKKTKNKIQGNKDNFQIKY